MNVGNADETEALIVAGASTLLLAAKKEVALGGGSIGGRFADVGDGSELVIVARAVGVDISRLLPVFLLTFGSDVESRRRLSGGSDGGSALRFNDDEFVMIRLALLLLLVRLVKSDDAGGSDILNTDLGILVAGFQLQ